MRTATTIPSKSVKRNFSRIQSLPAKENLNPTVSHLETTVKHYLLYNLDILLEVSKHEKLNSNLESAASIIREYEFLSLLNNMNQQGL